MVGPAHSTTRTAGPSSVESRTESTTPAPYLASGPALIKALKASRDPPEQGWPSKILIARQAWSSTALDIQNKGELLRDWIFETWQRVKAPGNGKGKGKESHLNPLTHPKYSLLLLDLFKSEPSLNPASHSNRINSLGNGSSQAQAMPAITVNLLRCLPGLAQDAESSPSETLDSFYSCLYALTRGRLPKSSTTTSTISASDIRSRAAKVELNSAAGEVDSWMEVFLALLTYLRHQESPVDGPLMSMTLLVVEELLAAIAIPINRRKLNATAILPSLDDLLHIWSNRRELRDLLSPVLEDVIFSISELQSSNPTANALKILDSSKPQVLAFLSGLTRAFTNSMHRHRFGVFPVTSSALSQIKQKRIPPEVYVSNRIREAILKGTRAILDFIPDSTDVTSWQARLGVWAAIRDWGGYFEGDEGWQSLFKAEVRSVAGILSARSSESTSTLLESAKVLTEVDFFNFQAEGHILEETIIPCCLTANISSQAEAIILHTIQFFSLTQDIPRLVGILANAIAHASAADYKVLGSSVLFGNRVTEELLRAFRLSLGAGVAPDRGWGLALKDLDRRLLECVNADQETSSKKRRAVDGSSRRLPTRMQKAFALLSRVEGSMIRACIDANGNVKSSPQVDELLNSLKASLAQESDSDHSIVAAGRARIRRDIYLVQNQKPEANSSTIALESEDEMAFESFFHATVFRSPDLHSGWTTGLQTGRESWSGRLADIDSSNVGSALATIATDRGLLLLHDVASDLEVKRLIEDVLKATSAGDSPSDKWTFSSSLAHWPRKAVFWELPRFRDAFLSAIEETTLETSLLGLLTITPPEYFSKATRNKLVDKVQQDIRAARPGNAERLAFLAHVAETTMYIGNLISSPTVLLAILSETENDAMAPLQRLLRIAIKSVLSDLRNNARSAVILNMIASELARHPVPAIQMLLLTEVSQSSLEPFDIDKRDLQVIDALAERLSASLQTRQKSLDLEILSTCLAVAQYVKWRKGLEGSSKKASKMREIDLPDWAELVQATSRSVRTKALPKGSVWVQTCLNYVAQRLSPDTNVTSTEKWLAAWILLAKLVPKTRTIGATETSDSDAAEMASSMRSTFQGCFRNIQPEVYQYILRSTTEAMGQSRDDMQSAMLMAMDSLLAMPVAGVGKLLRRGLGGLLSSMLIRSHATMSSRFAVTMIDILNTIVSEKTTFLNGEDVSAILGSCRNLLSVRQNDLAGDTGDDTAIVFTGILKIVNDLVRHRQDIVSELLPLTVTILGRALTLFVQPRSSIQSSKLREKVTSQWPSWMRRPLTNAEGMIFSRTLITLTSRSTNRNKGAETKASQAGTTIVGQLSKHAPALLVTYVRAATHPYGTLPPDVREALEPGLLALCEAITAGGKAQFGLKGGQGVVDAFGLAEADPDTREAELDVWGRLWRQHKKKRYAGQG